ncbi:MAG TPA: Rrf2 family transcriptional regulator [Rhodopila sp.]|jgi:Rrf2 family nitric oxide-sensitive transcriptional repressor
MRLTTFSDYTLRVLMYLALYPERFVTISEIAAALGVSANHLMKVAQHLASRGDVLTLRGPRGGLRLGRPAEAISVGSVIRGTEPDMALVPCGACLIHPECGLSGVLDQALAAFMAVLDGSSVADLVARHKPLTGLLAARPSGGNHRSGTRPIKSDARNAPVRQ